MKNNLQALREYQSQVDLSELEKSIYISIDRLTVILDRDNCSLRRIFWELRNSIDSIIQEFSIQANLKEDYFTLSILPMTYETDMKYFMENKTDLLYKKIYTEKYDEIVKKYDIKNIRKINFEINEEKEYAELSESKKKLYDYFTKTTK